MSSGRSSSRSCCVADGAYVLALVSGDRRADVQAIAAALGAQEVRVATAEEVVHATGFEPGGVAPFPQRAITQDPDGSRPARA